MVITDLRLSQLEKGLYQNDFLLSIKFLFVAWALALLGSMLVFGWIRFSLDLAIAAACALCLVGYGRRGFRGRVGPRLKRRARPHLGRHPPSASVPALDSEGHFRSRRRTPTERRGQYKAGERSFPIWNSFQLSFLSTIPIVSA